MRAEIASRGQGPTLEAYLQSKARVALIMGPLGSGKTFASCDKLFRVAINQKPNKNNVRLTRIYAIRNTYSDLLTTTIKDWLDLFGHLGKYRGSLAPPPSHHMKFRLPDQTIVDCEIVFLALDKPAAVKRLRGAQVTAFWLNEVKELPKNVIDMADSRHGRYPSKMHGGCTWHGMIGDYNAPDDDHWLYKLAEEEKPEGWEFFRQPGGVIKEYDEKGIWTGKWIPNPEAENIHNLPEGYYEQMLEGKSDDWISVNMANNYGTVRTGQPIYEKEYDDALHIDKDIIPIPETTVYVGVDFGLTPAACFIQESSLGFGFQMCHEAVGNGIGISEFTETMVAPILRKYYKDCDIIIVGDPAGKQRSQVNAESPIDRMSDILKIPVLPASTNNFDVRCDNVKKILTTWYDKKPGFRLHPRCKMTRKGFMSGYCLRRIQVIGEEKYTSVPDKNIYSHIHEAVQYCADYLNNVVLGSFSGYKDFKRPNRVNY